MEDEGCFFEKVATTSLTTAPTTNYANGYLKIPEDASIEVSIMINLPINPLHFSKRL